VNFRASRTVSPAVDAQVAYADVLLVTKRQLASPGDVAAVRVQTAALAPRALIRDGATDDHAAWLEQVLADPSLEAGELGAPHVHDEHCDHTHGIDSVWTAIPDVVDLEELEDRLADLPANYVRIKGVARAVDGRVAMEDPHWVAFHRVGLRVSSEPAAEPSFHVGRVVALGSSVDVAELAACVSAATVAA
jgi:G3E family GTPase